VVDDYLAHYEASKRFGARSRQAEMWEWASEELDRLVRDDPSGALEIVGQLIEAAPNDAALAYVAAGPLETLLTFHGEQLIRDVEESAAKNGRFCRALSGVWTNDRMSPAVQARIVAAVGDMEPL
jgi:hypothetical protein